MKKILLIILLIGLGWLVVRFVIGGSEDSWICEKGEWVKHGVPRSPKPDRECEKRSFFEGLGAEEKQEMIVELRDEAIREAEETGEYRCCIKPACTMCYMEANRWNNFKAGTCACDDLLAQGEEACPQCKNGLCEMSSLEMCEN